MKYPHFLNTTVTPIPGSRHSRGNDPKSEQRNTGQSLGERRKSQSSSRDSPCFTSQFTPGERSLPLDRVRRSHVHQPLPYSVFCRKKLVDAALPARGKKKRMEVMRYIFCSGRGGKRFRWALYRTGCDDVFIMAFQSPGRSFPRSRQKVPLVPLFLTDEETGGSNLKESVHKLRMNASDCLQGEPERTTERCRGGVRLPQFPGSWLLSAFLHKCFLSHISGGQGLSIFIPSKSSSYMLILKTC